MAYAGNAFTTGGEMDTIRGLVDHQQFPLYAVQGVASVEEVFKVDEYGRQIRISSVFH